MTGDTRQATDQLVAIATLAAPARGQFVTATLIPLFLELGRLFEERSSLGARAAIEGVRAPGARHAMRWRDGREERVSPHDLRPGDKILVRPGERIAAVVTEMRLSARVAVEELLRIAATCGFGSLHPVSRAVVAEALERGIVSNLPTACRRRPDLG